MATKKVKKAVDENAEVMIYFRIPKSLHDSLKKQAEEHGIFLKKLLKDIMVSGSNALNKN